MRDEYHALIKNKTWTLVHKPPDTNIVRCMWLFRHKYLADGTLSRYKARLVANGIQLEGVYVDETFSLVVKPDTIQSVLSLAVSRHWPIHQLDVKNAFLHGDLPETVYMHQPPRFQESVHPNYGTNTAYLLLYVDDIVLTDSSEILLQQIIRSLHQEFAMTDLGSLQYLSFTRPDISYAVQQPTLSHFSAEAEYRGVANAVAETCWLRNLLRELHTPLSFAMLVYCDNVSVVYLSCNPVQHQRTKHNEIDIHVEN
ncbi:ribonuclease H-like domain-containing protein [Tanacetum coccineum]